MKLIDVLIKLYKGEIKNGTTLTVNDKQYKYIENCFLDDYNLPLNIYGKKDLNSEVVFNEPEIKKYYLKLYKDDDLSYLTRSAYGNDFNYDFGNKVEISEFITKFTQDEINRDKILKFVERYGVKEEVEDNEDY